ncbi:MAG: TonB-dependent receptor [Wenzhouxiangellaceae bacterium]
MASAQSTADEDADEAKSPATLDSVTVTAQRRAENVQEVPAAVTVMSGEKLNILASSGLDVRFLSSRLPSLNIESSFGRAFPRFYIRGLGNTDFDLNASQPVSLVYDGVVQENPILKGFPVFDLERIENLLGPQGTLFGRNTPAGIVKFESARPTQTTEGYAQISYGRFNNLNFEGAIGGGLSDSWSARFSAYYQRRDDWVDNSFTGEDNALEGFDEAAARVQFLYDNGSNFNALINVHARTLDGTARVFRANIIKPGTNDIVDDFSRSNVAIDGRNEQELDSIGGSLTMNWDLGRTTLSSITGVESVTDFFSRGDVDGGFSAVFAPPSGPGLIPFSSETADGLPDHIQFSQELRLASNDWGAFDWQAGLYYFYEDITIDSISYDSLAGGVQNGFAVQEQESNSIAAFISADYDVSDNFRLRGGFRLSHDDKEFVAERFESPLSFMGVGPLGPLFANPDDTEYSWDLSATYFFNDDVNVYARVARGFRAPSIQGRILFGDVVSVADTETVISYEAGIKSLLADGRARLNFTAFRYVVDDQQLTAVGGANNFNTLINADQTKAAGFEFEAEAFISEQFLMTAGVSYNHTEIDDENLAIQPCGSGCTVLDPAGPVDGTVLLDGNRLPHAPRWVANVTARYSVPVADGELFVYTDWAYRSKVSFFLYESVEFTGESLLEGGLRIGYNWNYGDQELALFGRNITNNLTIVNGIDFNNLTGFVNEPRTWGVEYTHRF